MKKYTPHNTHRIWRRKKYKLFIERIKKGCVCVCVWVASNVYIAEVRVEFMHAWHLRLLTLFFFFLLSSYCRNSPRVKILPTESLNLYCKESLWLNTHPTVFGNLHTNNKKASMKRNFKDLPEILITIVFSIWEEKTAKTIISANEWIKAGGEEREKKTFMFSLEMAGKSTRKMKIKRKRK